MDVTVRRMKLGDMARVEEIQGKNLTASQWAAADYLAYTTWVAEVGGEVVGFLCVLEIPEDEAEILNLAVEPGWKKRGVGTRLLEEVRQAVVHLDVRAGNEEALRFYRSKGFTKVGHRRKYYQRPVEDAVMMSRRVPR